MKDSVAAPSPTLVAPHLSGPPAPAPTPPVGQAASVATAFAAAWARPDLDAATWLAALAPLCQPSFAQALATTDPGNVPAHRVTGPAVAVSPPANGRIVYQVPTDAGTLTVVLVSTAGQWLVADNDFQRGAR